MYQIFFVFATSERETERGYAIFNIATALVRSLVCCMPPKVAMWLLHFCPIPKKLTQRKGEQIGGGGAASTCATPEPELDQTSIFIDFILCIFSSFPFLFSGIMCLCISSTSLLQNLTWLQVRGARQRAASGYRQRHL